MALVVSLAVWVAVLAITRYVSLASIVGALVLPAAATALREDPVVVAATALVALIVALRHRSNLRRLARGQESRLRWTGGRRGTKS